VLDYFKKEGVILKLNTFDRESIDSMPYSIRL